MATIEELLRHNETHIDNVATTLRNFPDCAAKVFKPLRDTGFTDFKWVGAGVHSFLVQPTDNDKIVFRVSAKGSRQKIDTPFLLKAGYENDCNIAWLPSQPVHLDMLLAGSAYVSEQDKRLLLEEMKQAGWDVENRKDEENLWRNVINIPYKGGLRPIICDPLAMGIHFRDLQAKKMDGTLNSCSSNYITLQDQADAYNTAIENDPTGRLKKLIPKPVTFPETEVIRVEPKRSAGVS